MVKRKYLGQSNKDYIKTFESKIIRVDEEDIKGWASRLDIIEANRPRIVGESGLKLCLGDDGYCEIGFMPGGENWTLWAVYNADGKPVEWYFDITRKNGVDEYGKPYFDDLYLDAALMPDGRVLIFDEDELHAALDSGGITQAEYDMAYRTLDMLREKGILTVAYTTALCERLRAVLNNDNF